MLGEPVIETAEAVRARFHFDTAITTKERNQNITAEPATGGAGQRHSLGCKATISQSVDDCSFDAVSLATLACATHD